jgi:phospholipase/carboxylesterase
MTKPTSLNYLESKVSGSHKSTLIWLHGLGDSGHGHQSFAQELSFPEELGVKFIFPHAPSLPVSINGGQSMPAWYDILEMNLGRKIDEDGLENSAIKISELIQNEVDSGIESKNIILVGFSQGGAVALHTALKYPVRLGGIVCMSTYLGTNRVLSTSNTPVNKNIPIFWGHGRQDPVVPLSLALESIETLKKVDYDVDFHEYDMEHSIHPKEVIDVQEWITTQLQ